MFWVAREYKQPFSDLPVSQWPWTWVELAALCRYVDGVYERASVLDTDPPPKRIIFDAKLVDRWFEEAKNSG